MRQILRTIRSRHSERGPFYKKSVAKADIKQILEAAQWAPTPHNMQNFEILVVDDKERLEAIGKIPAYMPESFLRENYAQLSFSEEELRVKRTGMLASEFPRAWTNPEAWNPESDYTFQQTIVGRSMRNTPALVVVLYDRAKRAPGSDRDILGLIGLGCVLENMWLMSDALGIGFHVLTIFSDSSVEKEIKKLLAVPDNMKVAFACGIGYPAKPSKNPRVRRNLDNFVHHNQFGHKDVLWSEPKS